MMRDAPLLESSSSSNNKKKKRQQFKKRRVSFVNAFALVLFCCSVLNLFLALRRNNITSRSFRREGENIVISSYSSSDRGSATTTTSCVKLSGKAYEECIERREEREKERKEREKAKKMKEANVRNYYEQRRKQKQEKFKERDEEKERLPAKGGRLGGGGGGTTTNTRALDEDAFGGADVDAMQTIREATVLEKPLERLEGGNGGKFAFPEEEGIHKADVMALQPCAGGKSSGAETTWLDVPERFERQNVQTRKKEFGKLSKKKVIMGSSSIKYHDKASLVLLPSGQVVAFWQSGKTVEGERGQHVRVATSEDEGVTFSNSWPLFSKYDEEHGESDETEAEEVTAQWTPVPHVDKDGNLLLFYAESDGGCEYRDRGKIRYVPGGSIKVVKLNLVGDVEARVDKDSQWTEPSMVYSVYEENFVPKLIANPLVALENAEDENTLILPFWRDNSVLQSKRELFTSSRKAQCRVKQNGEADTPATRTIRPKTTSAGVLVSKDGGATWRARGKIEEVPVEEDDEDEDGGGNNENWSVGAKTTTLTAPSVFESSGTDNGASKLIMYLRSQSGGVYVTESENSSYNRWSEAKKVSDLKREPGAKTFAQSWRVNGEGDRHRNVHIVAFNDHKKDELLFDSSSDSSNSKEKSEEEEEQSDSDAEHAQQDVINESAGVSETSATTRKRRVKLPDKVRTQLTLAISEDAGADAFDASWTKMKGSVAGVVGSGIAPGLMFHNPWVLRVGCKVLVAYSKMYVAKFGQGKNKEEAHYSVRVSHVEFTVNDENVCSSNMRRYVCGNDNATPEDEEDEEGGASSGAEEGEEEGSDERERGSRPTNKSKARDSLKALQLTRNIERRLSEHHH